MKIIRNNIALVFPEVMFLMSQANEDQTEGNIRDMGVRLAQEINNHITQYCPGNSLNKISIISHSLGGLISRAAIPYLEEHRSKLFNFITLSSPHMGYMFNSSTIIDAGMWFLKTWKKSQSL
jgi:triacylglycerol esterase/lipase EstA (alpha/beta hydrolase family)